jgi:hypothetical protein
MSNKKQLWLMPHQVELVLASLVFLKERCKEGTSISTAAEHLAKRYTINRIDEIITMISGISDE